MEPLETLPPLWLRVLVVLRDAGVRIEHAPIVEAVAAGDLAAARQGGFVPAGDGSLQLIRPQGPLAAADELAGALAAIGELRDVVVIGPDAVLDDAMVRHGLPRLGAAVAAPASSGLVRLIIETAFTPMEPADLHALLCADPGPVPRGIAWRLVSALHAFPSRAATTWRDALAAGLDTIDEPDRPALARRLRDLLDPLVNRTGVLTAEQLTGRLRVLTTWARGRLSTAPSVSELITFAEGLLSLVRMLGNEPLGRAQLRRLCGEVDRRWISGPVAEAGIASIPRPGAMLGPARVTVWWGFTRELAPAPPRLRLSGPERVALRSFGVTPPDPGVAMASEARRWRRPLSLTSGTLLLVCPRTNATGEVNHPHPMWDELCSSIQDMATAARLHTQVAKSPVAARRVQVALRPLPIAIESVRVAAAISLRTPESPSSLERLLGCSLAWALHYRGSLRRGLGAGPAAPSPLLFGTLAHHVLARVFDDGALTAEAAAARAGSIVDADLESLAENLALPDHQVERSTVKRVIIDAARAVGAILTRSGASVRGTELALTRVVNGVTVAGRADIVLDDPELVIDFKWGGSVNRERLASGTAVQLAAYAEMGRRGDVLPGIAYFVLRSQELLAPAGTLVRDATRVGAHTAAEMWHATLAALGARSQELAGGRLSAPGAIRDPKSSALIDGVMRVSPACKYCELATLCGRRARS